MSNVVRLFDEYCSMCVRGVAVCVREKSGSVCVCGLSWWYSRTHISII